MNPLYVFPPSLIPLPVVSSDNYVSFCPIIESGSFAQS